MDSLEALLKRLQKFSIKAKAIADDFSCVFESKKLDELSSDVDTYSGLEILALLFYFANFVSWYDKNLVYEYWQNGMMSKYLCKLNEYYIEIKE